MRPAVGVAHAEKSLAALKEQIALRHRWSRRRFGWAFRMMLRRHHYPMGPLDMRYLDTVKTLIRKN